MKTLVVAFEVFITDTVEYAPRSDWKEGHDFQIRKQETSSGRYTNSIAAEAVTLRPDSKSFSWDTDSCIELCRQLCEEIKWGRLYRW